MPASKGTKEAPHLSEEEVLAIIDFIADCDPIVVGGQSTNIWAEYYSARDPELRSLRPFTSKDIDFFANEEATKKLASSLEDGKIFIPGMDDHTPSAAVVVGKLNHRKIEVDFMATILGVDNKSIIENYVSLAGSATPNGKVTRILVMHPADCVKSRLANINGVTHRHDPLSIKQATASIKVLKNFADDLISGGAPRMAQRLLHDLEYVIRDQHIGKDSHRKFDAQIQPIEVLRHFANDKRLDERWRQLILERAIKRLERRIEKAAVRDADKQSEPGPKKDPPPNPKMPLAQKRPIPKKRTSGMDGR